MLGASCCFSDSLSRNSCKKKGQAIDVVEFYTDLRKDIVNIEVSLTYQKLSQVVERLIPIAIIETEKAQSYEAQLQPVTGAIADRTSTNLAPHRSPFALPKFSLPIVLAKRDNRPLGPQ
ncbi:uncharacterized protein RAG0_10000 [Rhynchosporium agropyri]|uniref:Uncharacterized protein n=1 Tax=Rhynchosporium agropyri TaxID=914238 RepID=A0A1E1KY02_9HELO|nr:uncharacterized protein RAG0_10000 [Rhynchosporium agropyri]